MGRAIGVLAAGHVAVGLVEANTIVGIVRTYPEKTAALQGIPSEGLAQAIAEEIQLASQGQTVTAVGVGFPGIIRDGVVQDSPNLQQMKGANLRDLLTAVLRGRGIAAPVSIFNDADAMAAAGAKVTALPARRALPRRDPAGRSRGRPAR